MISIVSCSQRRGTGFAKSPSPYPLPEYREREAAAHITETRAMPFEPNDFYVGMIAYFTVNQLRRHPRIRTTNLTRDTKPRPFVCYDEGENEAGESETHLTRPNTTRKT